MVPSIPSPILEDIESATGVTVMNFSLASGGCINHGGKVTTSSGTYFLKWNDLKKFPGMFVAEARGLSLLRGAAAVSVPAVIRVGEAAAFQYLLLEHIEAGRQRTKYWENFGSGLAAMHRKSADNFGLDHDNYIGSLPQQNKLQSSWVVFFIEQRLRPQLQMAIERAKVSNAVLKKFEQFFIKARSLFPAEPPALLHGDLWGGNIMTSSQGEPCLIDPAVYYGHREADLAMTHLFGGFHPSFLDSYVEAYPLQPGYEERLDIYNLYPLLVHVNLFGGGYLSQVVSILDHVV